MHCQRIQFICHAWLFIAVQSLAYCLKNLTDVVIKKVTIKYHFLTGTKQLAERISDIWIVAEEYLVMKRNIFSSCECIHWQERKLYIVILDEGIVFFVIEGNAYIIFLKMIALSKSLIRQPTNEGQLIGE